MKTTHKPGSAEFIRQSLDRRVYGVMNTAIELVDILIQAAFPEFVSNFDCPASAGEALHNGLFDYIDGTLWMSGSQARSDHRNEWVNYKGEWVRDPGRDGCKFVQRALDYRDKALAVMAGEWSDEQ